MKFTDEDIRDADEVLDEVMQDRVKTDGEYDLEIYLSTDGKHTVNGKARTAKGKKDMYMAVTKIYDQILLKYGTKQGQAVKEYKNGNGANDLGKCSKCGAPNAMSVKTGKPYCSAKCWLN